MKTLFSETGDVQTVDTMEDVVEAIFGSARIDQVRNFWGHEFARYMINAEPSCDLVHKIANTLKDSSDDVLETYRCILTSEEFHDEQQRSVLIRCLLYTSPSPRDATLSRMPSSA